MKRLIKWKKIGTVVTAAAMSLGMGMMSMADEGRPGAQPPVEKTGVLSIQGTQETPKKGAEFAIYKVLTFGDAQQLADGAYVYTNIAADEASPFKEVIDAETYGEKTGYEAVAEYPDQSGSNVPSSLIAQFAAKLAAVSAQAEPEAMVTIGTTEGVTLPYGYYLIEEMSAPAGSPGVKSSPMLVAVPQVQGSMMTEHVSVTVKSSAADIDKVIVDEEGNGTEAGSGAVGDFVNYRVTSDLPLYGADVEEFHYVIRDMLGRGLTYQNDMKISLYVGDQKIADLFGTQDSVFDGAVSVTGEAGGTVITVTVNDLLKRVVGGKELYKYAEDGEAEFVLLYSAKINEDAVMGNGGNINRVYLEYETNHRTEEKAVSSYTTSILLIKEEQTSAGNTTGKPLQGAEFKLSRMNGESREALTRPDGNPMVFVTDEEGKLTFPGLGEGRYVLEETKAPSGYNLDTSRREFTLTFDTKTRTWRAEGTPEVISLTEREDGPEGTFQTTITNVRGMALPGTGGEGAGVFRIVGGAVILFGGFMFLIYFKKRGKNAGQK